MDQSKTRSTDSAGGGLPAGQKKPDGTWQKLGFHLQGKPVNPDHLSPQRVFIVTIVAIFLAEIVAMIVIYYLTPLPYWADTLLDAMIMIVIIFPIMYYLVFRLLLLQIEERKRGETLMKKVLEILPVGIWITDAQGQIIQGNPASEQIWGGARYVGLEQYGEYKGWWSDTGKPIEPEEWAAVRAIKHKENILNEEIEIEGFDNTHKIILNSALPILDEKDNLQGAIIVNQDITRRRLMEKALLRTNELLEKFFFNIHTLIAYMDRDFNFIRVNEAYARAGGHPPEFFLGKNHFDLYPNEENLAIFQHVVKTGEPYSVIEKPFEYAEFPERGVTYWDWSLQPVKTDLGEVEGLVLSLVDATERVKARLQLAKQNDELRQLSQAERRQREFAESLTRATITLNTSLDLERVLYAIFEQIRKIIPFSGAEIALVEGQNLHFVGWMGFEDHLQGRQTGEKILPLDVNPLLRNVCQVQQALWIDAVHAYPDWLTISGLEWVASFMAVPLIAKGSVIGIINLYSETQGAFTQEVVDRLQSFAAPAALAIQNAQLYEAELRARQTAETMSAAAQAFSQKLDLEHVITTLLDYINCIVPSDICRVVLLDSNYPLTRIARGYGEWANLDVLPSFSSGDLSDSVLRRLMVDRRSLSFSGGLAPSFEEGQESAAQILFWLLVPITEGEKVIGYVELGRANPEPYVLMQIQWVETMVDLSQVAIENARLFEQVRLGNEQLQSLARKLVEVQENERYHIARELHDEAGQVLSSLKMRLGRLEQAAGCPAHIRQELHDLKETTDDVLEELHRLAMDLRPAVLDHLGLVVALDQYASRLNSDQLSVQFKAVGFKGKRLSPEVETSLYRIVQEALTNVVRHAHASNVGILLERGWGKVKVFIEDDGIGLDPERVISANCMGLIGMRERAEMLGGSLSLESAPGKGTSIIVEVPDVHTHLNR